MLRATHDSIPSIGSALGCYLISRRSPPRTDLSLTKHRVLVCAGRRYWCRAGPAVGRPSTNGRLSAYYHEMSRRTDI